MLGPIYFAVNSLFSSPTKSEEVEPRVIIEFFLNGTELSLNLVNSGNLINH